MTNASTRTRWVPRLIVGVACPHTLFVLPASPDPDPLIAARRDDRAAVALPTP